MLLACGFPANSQSQSTNLAPPAPPQMPAYLLVVGKTTDRTKITGYAASLPPIYAANNAYYAAIGGAGRGVSWLEGPWQDRSLILGSFPSRAAIDNFWWGEAYRTAVRKRDNAGVFSVIAISGDAPFAAEGADKGYLVVMTAPKNPSQEQAAQSDVAAQSLRQGVQASGGTILASQTAQQFTTLEGDTVFDRLTIAAWPSLAARDAYLASASARRSATQRAGLGISVVVSANGVPRTQLPPAAIPAQR
jgi:uncharacterized protein (DUF1330 family)